MLLRLITTVRIPSLARAARAVASLCRQAVPTSVGRSQPGSRAGIAGLLTAQLHNVVSHLKILSRAAAIGERMNGLCPSVRQLLSPGGTATARSMREQAAGLRRKAGRGIITIMLTSQIQQEATGGHRTDGVQTHPTRGLLLAALPPHNLRGGASGDQAHSASVHSSNRSSKMVLKEMLLGVPLIGGPPPEAPPTVGEAVATRAPDGVLQVMMQTPAATPL